MGFLWAGGGGGGGAGGGDVTGPASSTDNAIARFDGAGGKTLQNSSVAVSDVAAASVTVATVPGASPGIAMVVEVTEPTATTGASVAGKGLTLNAGDAVASTDTAGAATGGTITIRGGDAKRLTSGNANGGDVALIAGEPVGTGTLGRTILVDGAGATAHGLWFSSVSGAPRLRRSGASLVMDSNDGTTTNAIFSAGIVNAVQATTASTFNGGLTIGNSKQVAFSDGVDFNRGITAIATGVAGVRITDGSSGSGWMQWAGESHLGADGTNATTTFSNTGLSVTVVSGRKYGFTMVLFFADSLAADGAKFDFNGGTAAATNFRAHATLFDSALNLSTQVSALATAISAATVTGDSMLEVHGSFEPSGNGTFIPRYAQVAHTTGTLTLYRGSHLTVFDMP